MRIAMVGNFALTGNQTMAARALPVARLLASRGHYVRMALPVRTGDDRPGVENRDGVEIHQVGSPFPLGPLRYLWQVLWMAHLCFWWRPSLVFCFKPIAHSAFLLGLFLFMARLGIYRGSVVLDTDDWEGYGGWNEKQPFPGWLKRLVAWQEKWCLRHADAITAASMELARLATEAGAPHVVYLPNCLEDHPSESPDGSGAPLRTRFDIGSAPTVLVYTRFVEYGVGRLLDTFEAISRRLPQTVFVVAGSGLAGEEDDLRRLLEQRGLSDSIHLLGWVDAEDIPGLFAAADIALYLLDDNLLNRTKCPMKLAELVSAGVPVVADRVGQAVEYLRDGETGVLVEAGDVEEMARAATSLLKDADLRGRMGQAARGDGLRRLRWRAWLPSLEKAAGFPL